MNKVLEKAKITHNLSKNEIMELLSGNDEDLYKVANSIKNENKGNKVYLRGLIEFTNICKRNCFYCGLRAENKKVHRYELNEDNILKSVEFAVSEGIKTIVLQGGENNHYTAEVLSKIIKKIKSYDVAITLSIGERDYSDYKAVKEAGADRYLLRIETTDKNLYNALHPKMSFENRIKCLKDLKSLGYETGTGSLIGLPGQSLKSIAEDILFFKELNADMVGIGPFIPHPDTPLANADFCGNFDTSLKVMAITRLLLPDINIPATTAMETLKPNGRIIALNSGANVVMPNITELEFKKNYMIYPNKSGSFTQNSETLKSIINGLKSENFEVSFSKGFRNSD